MLGDIVEECLQRALEQQKTEGYIQLERGYATIPLPGIDVPFHSRYLWAGVMPFRACKSRFSQIKDYALIYYLYRSLEEDQSVAARSRHAYWEVHSQLDCRTFRS